MAMAARQLFSSGSIIPPESGKSATSPEWMGWRIHSRLVAQPPSLPAQASMNPGRAGGLRDPGPLRRRFNCWAEEKGERQCPTLAPIVEPLCWYRTAFAQDAASPPVLRLRRQLEAHRRLARSTASSRHLPSNRLL